jgi:hypothetical protein
MIFQWIGMVEYIPCYGAPAVHWGLLPASRLAGRKIPIEQNIKRRTGPALYVFLASCVIPVNCLTFVSVTALWLSHGPGVL